MILETEAPEPVGSRLATPPWSLDRFFFALRASEQEGHAAVMSARYNLGRLNILIVDDNRNMRRLLQSILRALGVKDVLEVQDVPAALLEMKNNIVDLIITDWHMQPSDGLDLVRSVRNGQDSPNPYVPIVMLTGHTELHRVCEARDAGVNEFLAKPISASSLYSRITSIIENPRPFIRTRTYFGPCRRRRDLGPPKGMKERRRDELAKAGGAEHLTRDEVSRLLNQ